MNEQNNTARLARLLYLLVIFFGVYAEIFIHAELINPYNPATTIANIRTNRFQFRLNFLSDLMMQLIFSILSLLLYKSFAGISRRHTNSMVLSVVVSVLIICLNMLSQYTVTLILDRGTSVYGFETKQIECLVPFFSDLHSHGCQIAQAFFGLWPFSLAYLSYQSDFIPKAIGILLLVSALSFSTDLFLFFLLPTYREPLASIVTLLEDIGEFAMCLWLLTMGVRTKY